MVMQSTKKKFIDEPLLKAAISEFLEKELERTWIGDVKIQKSPVATRITIEVLDPRRVIGRKGRKLAKLVDMIKENFDVDNPQINVIEIKNPWLEPKIVAKRAARGIEMGYRVRGVLYRLLRNIMENGALGAEIIASGKLGAKGAKARKIKVYSGFVPKAGDPARHVKYYHYRALTKSGVIGITVRIAPPDIHLPDKNIVGEGSESEEGQHKVEEGHAS